MTSKICQYCQEWINDETEHVCSTEQTVRLAVDMNGVYGAIEDFTYMLNAMRTATSRVRKEIKKQKKAYEKSLTQVKVPTQE